MDHLNASARVFFYHNPPPADSPALQPHLAHVASRQKTHPDHMAGRQLNIRGVAPMQNVTHLASRYGSRTKTLLQNHSGWLGVMLQGSKVCLWHGEFG